MSKKSKTMTTSLHGDVMINTRSNRQPRGIIGYEAVDAGVSGGRVLRLHKNGKVTWLLDTVSADAAMFMAEDLNDAIRGC
jgi:hypothetical protein|tara:strand:+ start:163 stop:402 length:240 start_codon:yes stop_codon:yes gene_type:complete